MFANNSLQNCHPKRQLGARRSAFTLVELLITVAVISFVTALALPRVRDALRDNALSSSANTVEGAFSVARGMAMRSRRPHGVLIERVNPRFLGGLNTTPPSTVATRSFTKDDSESRANTATRLSFMQVPADYDIGQTLHQIVYQETQNNNCTQRLAFYAQKTNAPLLYAAFDPSSPGHAAAKRLIGVGSKMRIGPKSDQRVTRIVNVTVLGGPSSTYTDLSAFMVAHSYNTTPPAIPPCGTAILPIPGPAPASLTGPGILIETEDFRVGGLTTGVVSRGLGILDPGNPPSESLPSYTATLECQFELNPIKAAAPPVALTGRAVVDLSSSGWRSNASGFALRNIFDHDGDGIPNDSTTVDAPRTVNDWSEDVPRGILVMFSPSGAVESVYMDRFEPNSNGTNDPLAPRKFRWERFPAPETLCFLVGTSDGVLDNIEKGALYPEVIPGTSTSHYSSLAFDANVDPVPNFARTGNSWIVVRSLSGHVERVRVAEQFDSLYFDSFYGVNTTNNPPAMSVFNFRLDNSRRLAFGGGS